MARAMLVRDDVSGGLEEVATRGGPPATRHRPSGSPAVGRTRHRDFRQHRPRSLVISFAWRSAVAFLGAGLGLHLAVSSAVNDHFQASAIFHADFVGHAVLEPLLADQRLLSSEGGSDAAAAAALLGRYAIDEHVIGLAISEPDGTVVASDDERRVGSRLGGSAFAETVDTAEAVHVTGDDSISGGASIPLRSYVPLDLATPLIAEIVQDPAPTAASARALTRLLDVGLAAGLVLLWGLLLPIARRASRDLDRQARTDDLTALLNRTGLERTLRDVVQRQARGLPAGT